MLNTRMYNASRLALIMSLVLLLGACSSTPTATTDVDPEFDFTGVRTVSIQPIARTPESRAVLSDMQIGRVEASLRSELERRGFRVVQTMAEADLLLVWHLVTEERTDIRSFDSRTRYSCWNCRRMGMGTASNVTVRQYTRGTFIVDMVDPAGMRAVWRSVVESRMGDLSDPTRAAQARETAVAAALADFPPGAASD